MPSKYEAQAIKNVAKRGQGRGDTIVYLVQQEEIRLATRDADSARKGLAKAKKKTN